MADQNLKITIEVYADNTRAALRSIDGAKRLISNENLAGEDGDELSSFKFTVEEDFNYG